MHSNQIVGEACPECDKRILHLELYRMVTEQQNIGLMIGNKSGYRPLNSIMDVYIELYGQALFLPGDATNWQVSFQPETEHSRHFDLSLVSLPEGDNLIIVADITNTVLKIESINTQLEEASHNATHDQLTGLANRAYLLEYAMQTLREAERYLGRIAIFVLDIDNFKTINDTFGHDTGDIAIRWIAERLRRLCRDSDFIARQGGDEFCVIQKNIKALDDVTGLAEKLVHGLCDTISTRYGDIAISSSIGISVFPSDGPDINTLLVHADKALYESKKNGRNCFQMYSKELNRQAVKKAAMVTSLYSAFDKNEFLLRYQPTHDVNGGGVVGLEAFVRWSPSVTPWSKHLLNEEGSSEISCDIFIHTVERMGRGLALLKQVVKTACQDLARWRKIAGHSNLTASLNCSLRQLMDGEFQATLDHCLQANGLPHNAILIEVIPEEFDSEDLKIQHSLDYLRSSHIPLVLDGFGCLKSSPLLLRQWKPDIIKMDMSSLDSEYGSAISSELIMDMVTMLRHLSGVPIHAGRVETGDQLSALSQGGCQVAQGFFLSKPMSAEQVTLFLKQHKTHAGFMI